MQYKITNISRTSATPAGIVLQLRRDVQAGEAAGKQIAPNKFAIIDKIDETILGWQEKGLCKIDPMKDPLVITREEIATQSMPATVQEVKLSDDIDDDDLGEPDFDLADAREAEMPAEGLVKHANGPTKNSAPISQSTQQEQNPSGAKVSSTAGPRVNAKEYRTETKNTAKATMMGSESTRQVSKSEEIDAMNPLLDEKAKSVDNSDDTHTVQAPTRSSFERGTTIKP